MENLKEFKDLEFVHHNDGYTNGIRARMFFPNGYGISVISNNRSYGGEDGLYEVGVLDSKGDLCYSTPVTDDTIGWLTERGVTVIMKRVQELPSVS